MRSRLELAGPATKSVDSQSLASVVREPYSPHSLIYVYDFETETSGEPEIYGESSGTMEYGEYML